MKTMVGEGGENRDGQRVERQNGNFTILKWPLSCPRDACWHVSFR